MTQPLHSSFSSLFHHGASPSHRTSCEGLFWCQREFFPTSAWGDETREGFVLQSQGPFFSFTFPSFLSNLVHSHSHHFLLQRSLETRQFFQFPIPRPPSSFPLPTSSSSPSSSSPSSLFRLPFQVRDASKQTPHISLCPGVLGTKILYQLFISSSHFVFSSVFSSVISLFLFSPSLRPHSLSPHPIESVLSPSSLSTHQESKRMCFPTSGHTKAVSSLWTSHRIPLEGNASLLVGHSPSFCSPVFIYPLLVYSLSISDFSVRESPLSKCGTFPLILPLPLSRNQLTIFLVFILHFIFLSLFLIFNIFLISLLIYRSPRPHHKPPLSPLRLLPPPLHLLRSHSSSLGYHQGNSLSLFKGL